MLDTYAYFTNCEVLALQYCTMSSSCCIYWRRNNGTFFQWQSTDDYTSNEYMGNAMKYIVIL
jgi:hypothetical protein